MLLDEFAPFGDDTGAVARAVVEPGRDIESLPPSLRYLDLRQEQMSVWLSRVILRGDVEVAKSLEQNFF